MITRSEIDEKGAELGVNTSDGQRDSLPGWARKTSGVDFLRGPFNAIGLLRAVERLIGRDPEGESGE